MTNRPKTLAKTTQPRKRIRILIYILISLVLLLAYDLTLGGNIRFYSKRIECGQKPVQPRIFYVGEVPHYSPSPAFSIMRLSSDYFCTPLEAEREGYSANAKRYDFPHIREAGEESPVLRDIRKGREQRQL